MNSEDKFKDSLKNLVESKEFSFDESNWEKAKDLMHPSDRSRNKFILFGSAAMILILSGFLAYTYVAGNEKPVIAEKITAPVFASTSSENKNADVTQEPVSTEANTTAIHNTAPTDIKKSDAAKSPGEPAIKPIEPAGSFSPSTEKTIPAATTKQNQPVATTPKKIRATTQNNQPVVIAVSPETHNEQKPVATSTKPANDTKPADNTKTMGDSKQTPATTTPVKETATPAVEPAIVIETKQPETKQIPEIKIPEVTQTQVPVAIGDKKPVEPIVETPKETIAAKPDTSAKTGPDLNFQVPQKKILFSFEAGANYLLGWKNPGKTDANGFNPVIGVNYFDYFGDKFAVSLGVQYTSVGNLSYANHVSKITRYDLGEENSVTVITPDKVHYLAVPVKLNYFINNNNAVGIGCNIAYLLTVDSKIETYDQRIGKKENYKIAKTRGYTEGFNTFDTQLSVFYRRRIYKNLSVNAEFVYGLTDIKSNSFFNSNVTERNTGLKLTLLFDIFK